MKRIIKGIIVPIVVAMLFGYVLGKYTFKIYRNNVYNDLRSSKLYLVENGEYDSIESMREENSNNNYIYYKDEDKYKTVIGITRNYDNISKINRLYSDNLLVSEYYIPVDNLDNKQYEYDMILSETNNIYDVKKVVDDILELYRTDNSIRLIGVS